MSHLRSILLILSIARLAKSNYVECESLKKSLVGDELCCFLHGYTTIDAEGVEVSGGNESVECMEFHENEKISFLPVSVYKAFPKLVDYAATNCSLTKILKKNFEQLALLQSLYLKNNFISEIEDGSFDDLKSLAILDLTNNKIKFMEGKLFAPLTVLWSLHLEKNGCINQKFERKKSENALTWRNKVQSDVDVGCALIIDPEPEITEITSKKSKDSKLMVPIVLLWSSALLIKIL